MPGHEAVGRISRVGSAVTRHRVGDIVGVGCMIDSCHQCEPCRAGEQNYREDPNSWLSTYNGPMVLKSKAPDGGNIYGKDNTLGGYSNSLVVREDFMLSTIPEKHDINPFIACLKRDATIVVVGALEALAGVDNMEVAMQRKTVGGSLIGNIADTQEVLDFCAEHAIGPEIELIPLHQINDALDKVENGDMRFRYVIEMSSLKPGTDA